MIQLIFLLFALFAAINLRAQTVSGTVYDAQTHESIPFCTIVLGSNSTNGTIANVNGDYIVNNAQQFDTIAFSAVGYERKTFLPAQLMQDATVKLDPRVYQISEIVVKPINIDSLLHDLKNRVWESYPNPYPVLGGVYRKQMVENGKLAFLGECELYCGVKNKEKRKEYIVETQNILLTKNTAQFGRFLFIPISNSTRIYSGYSMLYYVKKWNLLEITSSEDGKSDVYVFQGTYRDDGVNMKFDVTLHYHVNDNAILSLCQNGNSTEVYKKRFGDKLYYNSAKSYYKYGKNYKGKYVLKYARTEMDFSLDRKNGEHIDCIYTMDYVVTNDIVSGIQPTKKPNYDPFRKAKGKVVEQSELRVIPPDYKL